MAALFAFPVVAFGAPMPLADGRSSSMQPTFTGFPARSAPGCVRVRERLSALALSSGREGEDHRVDGGGDGRRRCGRLGGRLVKTKSRISPRKRTQAARLIRKDNSYPEVSLTQNSFIEARCL
jgi:hypothetical protein